MSDTGAFVYDVAGIDFLLGQLTWGDGLFSLILVSDEYRPRRAADSTLGDIPRSARITEPVRVRGLSINPTRGGRVALMADPVRIPTFTGDFRYAVIYNALSTRLVAYSDLGAQSVENGAISLEWPAGEVCELLTF